MPLNVEIKARCSDLQKLRKILAAKNAEFKGTDHQTDTYFRVASGRLKLREGDIENALVFYLRNDQKGPKESHVSLLPFQQHQSFKAPLKEMLTQSLGVRTVVKKKREIYFIDNVKIHLDDVEDLGTFVEIEAIDDSGSLGKEHLQRQCRSFMELFGITEADLIDTSYERLIQSG